MLARKKPTQFDFRLQKNLIKYQVILHQRTKSGVPCSHYVTNREREIYHFYPFLRWPKLPTDSETMCQIRPVFFSLHYLHRGMFWSLCFFVLNHPFSFSSPCFLDIFFSIKFYQCLVPLTLLIIFWSFFVPLFIVYVLTLASAPSSTLEFGWTLPDTESTNKET